MSTEVFQVVSQASFDAVASTKPRAGRTKRIYRCKFCERVFKRSEHCARHERVHTQERPFPCAFCDRRYARKDLVKRHERSLHVEQYKKAHPEEFRRGSSAAASSISEGEENSTGSSRGTGHPLSPLTPPTQPTPGPIDANAPAMGGFADHDLSILQEIQPAESHSAIPILSPMVGDFHGQEFYAFDMQFSPMDLFMAPTPYPVTTPEPPTKRRRIEIDPQLLLEDEARATQAISPTTPMSQRPSTSTAHTRNYNFSMEYNDGQTSSDQPTALDDPLDLAFHELSADYPTILDFNKPFQISPLTNGPHTASLPHVQKDSYSNTPRFPFNNEVHRRICEDAKARIPSGELSESLFPTVNDLNQFFSGYLECFHKHFPILHLSSLDIKETPSPLIFAICSIGALYRLARQKSRNLFALAGTMSSNALRRGLPITATGTPKPAPIWIMQTRVLLSLGGMFSGKTNVVLRTIENLGLFAIDYRLRMASINQDKRQHLEWEDWISRESNKRLLCGMFIVSNLISTTYNISPGFSHTYDLDFEVLDEEARWEARSAQEWKKLSSIYRKNGHGTVRQTMAHIIFNVQSNAGDWPEAISGMTMLLMMHAMNSHIWSLTQVMNPSGTYNDVAADSELHETMFRTAFSTLSRCEEIIQNARGNIDDMTTWNDTEGPLMFNCHGLVMMAYARLFSETSIFNRLTLLSDNHQDIKSATKSYAQSPLRRSPGLTKTVRTIFDPWLSAMKIGHQFVKKTAALSWSVEHAISGWDSALLLTKWAHVIETGMMINPLDEEESFVLNGLRELVEESGTKYHGNSLAAALANTCAATFDDVWVWGITPKMSNILQQLGIAYEKNYQAVVPGGRAI
ncbi:hypothetical protein BS50DRAFT_501736 [Corynespora cassiicola Philippines]|uniref:C2H2-type domain-containing protein n=1 Tax=Corynespora cassiicola Philippines TaxID=1448308 RepID=A0A2T2NAT4_CORCC|nr:hypothetical protein BS50DRAFT_501736 [Corynespora cassiicola Philippines]